MNINISTVNYTLSRLFFLLLFVFAMNSALFATDDINNRVKIIAFGDSLTAGYGLGPGEGFTDRLQVWLRENGHASVDVVNAGVSGDTSSGGRSRLDWALAPIKGGKPDLLILELGANDGLRGIDPDITRDNIFAIVKSLRAKGVPVLVAGMIAPPNLGPDYAESFNSIFSDVATQYAVKLYPFFLDGVAADPSLNQGDGIHPNKKGVDVIINRLGPVVSSVLNK